MGHPYPSCCLQAVQRGLGTPGAHHVGMSPLTKPEEDTEQTHYALPLTPNSSPQEIPSKKQPGCQAGLEKAHPPQRQQVPRGALCSSHGCPEGGAAHSILLRPRACSSAREACKEYPKSSKGEINEMGISKKKPTAGVI